MNLDSINIQYSELAETTCCQSTESALIHANVKRGEIGAVLGCGRGTDVIRMAEKVGSEGFVYGIDCTEDMISKAQNNAKKLGIDNARFIQSELEKLPLESQSVQVIISNCTINQSENKQKVWNEIYRVLKKGGRFIVSDIYSLQPVAKEYSSKPQMVAECWAGAVTKEEYFRIIDNAGFSDVQIIEESKPYKKGNIFVSSFTITSTKTCCC